MSEPWTRAGRALAVLAVDPAGLGGLWLRARAGPVRDRLVAALPVLPLPLPLRKLHPGIGDDALYGGLDLAATLAQGHLARSRGLLDAPAALVLTMAERCPPGLAARLAAALDTGPGHALVVLDEGAEPAEAAPETLTDRLAFHVDLDGLGCAEARPVALDAEAIATARARRDAVDLPAELLVEIPLLAVRLGIAGLRAPLLALRAARAIAALDGIPEVGPEQLAEAAALVLAPRATVLPETEDTPPEPPQDPEPEAQSDPEDAPEDAAQSQDQPLPAELLLEAVAAALPPDLLARLAAQKARRDGPGSAGTGTRRKGSQRGRPLPSRPGRLDGVSRLDLVATLRAAAPWQTLRRAQARAPRTLHVRPEDIRLKRYEDRADRLLIFTVDASGSAALSRLAEAKGAVELLLAEAYARRDHVALVAYRGTGAETLLPPTRSLVQTKRRLAGLPGGGGTPLAAGLQMAMALAVRAQGRGMTPTLCLLADGRANIALDGSASRERATADAERIARAARAADLPALVIDMSRRPQPGLRAIADMLAAPYVPMPRADAHGLSRAVGGALAE